MLVSDNRVGAERPCAPSSLSETGLSSDLILQLLLKTLHFAGELTGSDIAARVGLGYGVIEPVLQEIKNSRHCEIVGGGLLGGGSYRYRISDAGRSRASLFLEQNHYVGFAPVPLEQYRRYMRAFQTAGPKRATRDRVREAFSHLVISQRVLDQLGPAINAGHSMFVYGPPGNGKTVISHAIRHLLDGELAIPHAIEVEGSIIRFFDPVNHEALPEPAGSGGLDIDVQDDKRWVRCRRPMVTVGGELSLDQLELSFSPSLGFYRAPVQAIANGGVLVIDDFGRQACSPRDLLNRWIVPLESRVDFLALQTGQKFDFPFMTMIVFATNMQPKELVDEAFLRRIHYKVYAESPTPEEFLQIFEGCCRQRDIEYNENVIKGLIQTYLRPRQIELRGCQPRDLLNQMSSLAEYLDEPFELNADLLESACNSYFLDDRSQAIQPL